MGESAPPFSPGVPPVNGGDWTVSSHPQNGSDDLRALQPDHDVDQPPCTEDTLLGLWEENRRSLPGVRQLSDQQRIQCRQLLNKHQRTLPVFLHEFRYAVIEASLSPLLQGDNPRGWMVTFDWVIASDTNRLFLFGARHVIKPPAWFQRQLGLN